MIGKVLLKVLLSFLICLMCESVVIQNLQQYCQGNTCRGLNYSSNENLQFETFTNFIQTQITFVDSDLSTIPWNMFVVFPHLKILNMENCNMQRLEKWNFENGGGLLELMLSENEIKSLPNEVFIYLKNLTYLDLEQNKIGHLLFDTFHGLSQLQVLYLDDNKLTTLPWDLLKPLKKLEIIGLSDNQIKRIDQRFFEENSNLKQVYLGNNQLTIIDTYFPEYLRETPIYERYVKSSTEITSSSFLFRLRNVEKLDLSMNFIGYISNETFLVMDELRHLNLSTTNLISLHLYSFMRQSKLITLDISENNQRYINTELFTPMGALVNLFLDGNQLSDIDYKKLLSKHPALNKIGLSNNNWRCSYLSSMISSFHSRRVELYMNPYYTRGQRTTTKSESVSGIDCT